MADPEVDDSATVLDAALDVSRGTTRSGDFAVLLSVSSTHPAGVGGTGPNVDMGGRRVGGEETRSVLVMLCDLDCGGGPGGGGGRGLIESA